MASHPLSLVALLHGPDKPGLVARVSNWIYERGGNIIHADQHRDETEQIFFQRLEWSHEDTDLNKEAELFRTFAEKELGVNAYIALSTHRPKIGVMVSKIPHCFQDFLLRWHGGDFQGEVACVVSNHTEMRTFTGSFGLPFHHVPLTADNKAEAEAEQLKLFHSYGVELVVMARYMQVLSEDFLNNIGCAVINIHHSFLPAFAGGKPYHQAHARGVKLIGATAHYATADLDQGPIIAQDVTHINHRHSVDDLIRRGRDLEKAVFAQAIRWHLQHRVLAYKNKTVVFD